MGKTNSYFIIISIMYSKHLWEVLIAGYLVGGVIIFKLYLYIFGILARVRGVMVRRENTFANFSRGALGSNPGESFLWEAKFEGNLSEMLGEREGPLGLNPQPPVPEAGSLPLH